MKHALQAAVILLATSASAGLSSKCYHDEYGDTCEFSNGTAHTMVIGYGASDSFSHWYTSKEWKVEELGRAQKHGEGQAASSYRRRSYSA